MGMGKNIIKIYPEQKSQIINKIIFRVIRVLVSREKEGEENEEFPRCLSDM